MWWRSISSAACSIGAFARTTIGSRAMTSRDGHLGRPHRWSSHGSLWLDPGGGGGDVGASGRAEAVGRPAGDVDEAVVGGLDDREVRVDDRAAALAEEPAEAVARPRPSARRGPIRASDANGETRRKTPTSATPCIRITRSGARRVRGGERGRVERGHPDPPGHDLGTDGRRDRRPDRLRAAQRRLDEDRRRRRPARRAGRRGRTPTRRGAARTRPASSSACSRIGSSAMVR